MAKFIKIKMMIGSSIRMLMHDSLFLVCMAMSIGMFIQFGNSWWTKAVMGLVAAVFESTKLYDLLKAKRAWKNKAKGAVASNGLLYLAKAILSVVASVGFALVLLAAQKSVAEVSQDTVVLEVSSFDEDVDFYKNEINRIQGELFVLSEAISRADGNYGTSITKISSNKPALEESLKEAVANWQEAKNKKLAFQTSLQNGETEIMTNPADMFNELSAFINEIRGTQDMSSFTLMVIIFIAIMLILEISVATTSGELPEEEVEKETEADLKLETAFDSYGEYYNKFIDAMFEGASGDRVNSVQKIMELTNMNSSTCWKIRQSILTMTYKGKKILVSSRGRTQAGMTRDNMKRIVDFLLRNPSDDILIPELP